jgi:CheY-like chemotaxis protein
VTKALVIEDNEFNRTLATYLLRAHGLEVAVAASGSDGMSLLDSFGPDIVLCDIGMPDFNGLQVAEAIRSTPRWAHVRLVALTAYSMPGDRDDALRAGFDDYMAKPIDPQSFAMVVEQLANEPTRRRDHE